MGNLRPPSHRCRWESKNGGMISCLPHPVKALSTGTREAGRVVPPWVTWEPKVMVQSLSQKGLPPLRPAPWTFEPLRGKMLVFEVRDTIANRLRPATTSMRLSLRIDEPLARTDVGAEAGAGVEAGKGARVREGQQLQSGAGAVGVRVATEGGGVGA